MNGRAPAVCFVVAACVASLVLLLSAAGDERTTAFSLDVANGARVDRLASGETACQGPIQVPTAFAAARIWLAPASEASIGLDVLRGRVVVARGRAEGSRTQDVLYRVAVGTVRPPFRAEQLTIKLDRGVPSRSLVEVCVRNGGPSSIDLVGGPAPSAAGRLTVAGRPDRSAVAIVFLRSRPRTFLSMLSTVFARAALFKARWVGAWTFWVLSGAVIGALFAASLALSAAVREDERSGSTRR
jgi:hypothetical protein